MHSDSADDVRKGIRGYLKIGVALWVFTIITVAVNQVHLAIPLAITVALLIAVTKGSMVAAVFMHLSHEKKWIYGSLIMCAVGFILVILLPLFTIGNTFGTPIEVARGAAEHAAR
jgi:caa(3)-type oxidase subunit IV